MCSLLNIKILLSNQLNCKTNFSLHLIFLIRLSKLRQIKINHNHSALSTFHLYDILFVIFKIGKIQLQKGNLSN